MNVIISPHRSTLIWAKSVCGCDTAETWSVLCSIRSVYLTGLNSYRLSALYEALLWVDFNHPSDISPWRQITWISPIHSWVMNGLTYVIHFVVCNQWEVVRLMVACQRLVKPSACLVLWPATVTSKWIFAKFSLKTDIGSGQCWHSKYEIHA